MLLIVSAEFATCRHENTNNSTTKLFRLMTVRLQNENFLNVDFSIVNAKNSRDTDRRM